MRRSPAQTRSAARLSLVGSGGRVAAFLLPRQQPRVRLFSSEPAVAGGMSDVLQAAAGRVAAGVALTIPAGAFGGCHG